MTGTETIARSAIYGLLARLMLGDWDLLKQELSKQKSELDSLTQDLQEILHILIEKDPFDLKLEYDNLFLVPGKYYAPPFERVYKDSEGIEDKYMDLMFFLPEERGESPDHIGCELAFMQALVLGEKHALNDGEKEALEYWRDQQRLFLNDHLAAWISQLREKVQEKEPEGFFVKVLSFAEAFVLSENVSFAN